MVRPGLYVREEVSRLPGSLTNDDPSKKSTYGPLSTGPSDMVMARRRTICECTRVVLPAYRACCVKNG